MELLENKIRTNGKVIDGHILKVDSFLNHQIDVSLMKEIGNEFYTLFNEEKVTKVLTIESSGIAPAVFTASKFNVDVIFARKRKSLTLNENLLSADIFSYTKNETNTVSISGDFINKDDSILIIDDFLANGEVLKGLIKIIEQSGAKIAGIGIVIEKSFQKGRAEIDATGIHIESLARIKSLENNEISFV